MSRYKHCRKRHNRAWKREQAYSRLLLKYNHEAYQEYASDIVANFRLTARLATIRIENERMYFDGSIFL